jgi:glyoxylase-like metal-dependent hydrolase (beta-lactamase superfamily II)
LPEAEKHPIKDEPIEIAPDVWWVGSFDENFQCNSYLVKGSTFHVLIDSGSRPQFPKVLLKILKIGIAPQDIGALIYQHPDPDLCGNIVDFVELIDNKNLKIISDEKNLPFIAHYAANADLMSTQSVNHNIVLDSRKRIQFYNTPHCHNGGSFISFEESTSTLFSSDIFGSYKVTRSHFLNPQYDCESCRCEENAPITPENSDLWHLLSFHRDHFPSTPALMYALDIIERIPYARIAPQHGAILPSRVLVSKLIHRLRTSGEFGIERILNLQLRAKATKGMRFP